MPPWVQKPAIIMLTMQFDQQVRQVAQHIGTGAAVVDPGGLAPVGGGGDAAQDQLIPGNNTHVGQKRAGAMVGRQVKAGRHFALFCALAHQIGAPAPTQNEPQTVQQDRLACPGFAGQHIQAGLKHQIQPINDQHVADFKGSQHQARTLHARRRVRDLTHLWPMSQPFTLDHLPIDRGKPTVALGLGL